MAAPTLVATYGFPTAAVATTGTTFPATVSAAVGDRLVAAVVATDENPPTFSTPTVPTGSGIVWTLQQSYATPAGWCAVNIWTGTVTTAFTSQVISTQAVTGTSNDSASFGVWRWSGSAGFGVSGKNFSNPGAVSVTATLSANSGICMIYGDFNNGAAPTFLTNAGAAVTDLNQTISGDSRIAAGHHVNSGTAGSKALGTSAPTSAKATFLFVEVLASGLITAAPADPLGITDAVSRVLAASRTVADPLGLTDAVVAVQGRSAADPLGMTDAVTIAKGKLAADPLCITDAITVIHRDVNKTINDALPMSDNVVIQFTRVPIQEYQFVIPAHDPYVPFGRGQTVDISKFDPGTSTIRNQDTAAARGDYRVFGTDRKVPPTWGWELWTNCTTVGDARGWVELLSQVWDDDVRQGPGAVLPLSYRVDGAFRRVYGRPRNFTPDYSKIQTGKIYVVADFALSEDTYYDEDEQTVTAQGVATATGGSGVILPQPLPWVFTAMPVPRTNLLVVGGTKQTWLTPTFYGPAINPWVQIGTLTWALKGTIPAGQTVTVSGKPWDVGIIRSTGARAPEMLDPRSRLSQLAFKPGTYSLTYGGQDDTGSSKVIVAWRNAHRTM
jgi:hypothetical protein